MGTLQCPLRLHVKGSVAKHIDFVGLQLHNTLFDGQSPAIDTGSQIGDSTGARVDLRQIGVRASSFSSPVSASTLITPIRSGKHSEDSTMAKQAKHAYPRKASVKGWVANRPPELHEKGYAVDGDCLEPVVHHGEIISAEPILPEPGELACFFFSKQDKGSVKRLITR